MYEISNRRTELEVQEGFIASRYNPRSNAISMVTIMLKLSALFRRTRTVRIRRPVDPTLAFTARDWADLPVFHPMTDEPRR